MVNTLPNNIPVYNLVGFSKPLNGVDYLGYFGSEVILTAKQGVDYLCVQIIAYFNDPGGPFGSRNQSVTFLRKMNAK